MNIFRSSIVTVCITLAFLVVYSPVSEAGNIEICNGVDDDGNGTIDDNLSDAPVAGQEGCWSGAGNCCSFAGIQWCPPPGATCSQPFAVVTTPPAQCRVGTLTCTGVGGWACNGSVMPTQETCDGIDNNCQGQVDENLVDGPPPGQEGCWSNPGNCCSIGALRWCPPPGATCGGPGQLSIEPPAQCRIGALACAGSWTCTGTPIVPTPEICDGIDNNCEGHIDEGLEPACPLFADGFE